MSFFLSHSAAARVRESVLAFGRRFRQGTSSSDHEMWELPYHLMTTARHLFGALLGAGRQSPKLNSVLSKGNVSALGTTLAQNDILLFVDLISDNASDDRSPFADSLVNRLDLTTMKWSTETT